ncbi:hypothetical protein [Oscillibacter sp.]|uniref:hypothetical protein n=1 Tax=Oscillibacter sp. TaxID=1945593 RepID=UPI002D807251|nr:hypothetical protein [Oscillibacter sp.]
MTQFDMLLRRALMDANLAQYERALRSVEAGEPDFSPGYLRERMRLLADPWAWARRRSGGRKRLDWRLIAIVAALLLLSACAYAVATGQFSQWFPRLGVDPKAPEVSEEVLNRTGTAIQQSQTVGDATVTLHAAVWDGSDVWLSFAIESPGIPEEVRQYTPIYGGDCRLRLRDDQSEEYARGMLKEHYAFTGETPSPEQQEADLRDRLEMGMIMLGITNADEREGNIIRFQINAMLLSRWFTETKRPELTLHLESIATYADGKGESIIDENGYAQNPGPGTVFIEGPFDLTFTLEEPILPIRYEGADVQVTVMDIPLHFTGFKLSALELTAYLDDPMEPLLPKPGETLTPEQQSELDRMMMDSFLASGESVRGLWTEDGTYVDLSNTQSSGGGGDCSRSYPYPIDPATVTAVDIAGIRVELSELERMDE